MFVQVFVSESDHTVTLFTELTHLVFHNILFFIIADLSDNTISAADLSAVRNDLLGCSLYVNTDNVIVCLIYHSYSD